jgi:phosphinothricin acetyltransferase
VSGGRIVGYAYAGPYRTRSAYRFTLENSVYVAADAVGGGIGTGLLAELIARCKAGPWRSIVAIIGDSANHASIALHRRFGFELVGNIRNAGFKHERWLDSVVMQLDLRPTEGG